MSVCGGRQAHILAHMPVGQSQDQQGCNQNQPASTVLRMPGGRGGQTLACPFSHAASVSPPPVHGAVSPRQTRWASAPPATTVRGPKRPSGTRPGRCSAPPPRTAYSVFRLHPTRVREPAQHASDGARDAEIMDLLNRVFLMKPEGVLFVLGLMKCQMCQNNRISASPIF